MPFLYQHIFEKAASNTWLKVLVILCLVSMNAQGGLPQSISFEPSASYSCTETIRLVATATSGLTVEFKVISGKAKIDLNGLLSDITPGKIRVQALQSGDSVFDSAISVVREIAIQSVHQQEVSQTALKNSTPLCIGDSVYFYIKSINGVSYNWSLKDGSKNVGDFWIVNTLSSSLNASGTIIANEGNCQLLSIDFRFDIHLKSTIDLSLVPDSVVVGDTIMLKGNPSSGVFSNQNVVDNLYFPKKSPSNDTILYTYKNEFNCISKAKKIVAKKERAKLVNSSEFKLYEYITPNGDAKNDMVFIENIEDYTQNELIIFNQWGNELYRVKEYANNWSPSNLTKGIYYYSFKSEKNSQPFTGHFYVSPE